MLRTPAPTSLNALTPSTPWAVTTPRYWVTVRPSIPGVVVMSIAVLLQRIQVVDRPLPRLDGAGVAVNRRDRSSVCVRSELGFFEPEGRIRTDDPELHNSQS